MTRALSYPPTGEKCGRGIAELLLLLSSSSLIRKCTFLKSCQRWRLVMNEEGYFSASSTSTDVTERALFPYRSFRRISFQSVIRARLVLSARPIYLSRLLIGVHSYSRFHIFLKSNRENCFPLCMQYPVFYPLRSDNNILFFSTLSISICR